MGTKDEKWYTTAEVSELIPGASQRSIQNWCKTGVFPGALRLPNGRWRIPASAVKEILDQAHGGRF